MESRHVIAGESIPELDVTKMKIKDASHLLDFDSATKTFQSAATGTINVSVKKVKESKGKRSSKEEKDKVQVDVYADQALSNYYFPKVGDMVIGKVIAKYAFSYELDINCYSSATLDALEFDGATKRNKPSLDVNTLVYCRVKSIDHLTRPELSCISPVHKKAWTSGESYFGELKGGYLCEITLRTINYLQTKKCYLLNELGQLFQFEIIVGFNGRVWVNCKNSIQNLVVIINCITQAEDFIGDTKKVDKLISRIRRTIMNV